MYAMRLNLSLAIVCMVKRSTNQNSTSVSNETNSANWTLSYLNNSYEANATGVPDLDDTCVDLTGNGTNFEVVSFQVFICVM